MNSDLISARWIPSHPSLEDVIRLVYSVLDDSPVPGPSHRGFERNLLHQHRGKLDQKHLRGIQAVTAVTAVTAVQRFGKFGMVWLDERLRVYQSFFNSCFWIVPGFMVSQDRRALVFPGLRNLDVLNPSNVECLWSIYTHLYE